MVKLSEFYKGKRVFVTGHTGFKGSWLCRALLFAGAEVFGFALSPDTTPNLFDIAGINGNIHSEIGDIRDYDNLKRVYETAQPQIVFHLAAQPLVIKGYNSPKYTYETNVLGTLNLLECVRTASVPPISVINVTTDKVYQNNESGKLFCEDDPLNGSDPYSNSKSCSELVTHSYINSYFKAAGIPVSTLRAGNVIGGGDFSDDRIIPDCVRAAFSGKAIVLRNPDSVRPYQHVLEAIFAYIYVAQKQAENTALAGCYNIGPTESDCVTTKMLAEIFCRNFGGDIQVTESPEKGYSEAGFLRLDCTKIAKCFGIFPVYDIDTAVQKVVEWSREYYAGNDTQAVMDRQIEEYFSKTIL